MFNHCLNLYDAGCRNWCFKNDSTDGLASWKNAKGTAPFHHDVRTTSAVSYRTDTDDSPTEHFFHCTIKTLPLTLFLESFHINAWPLAWLLLLLWFGPLR